MALKGPMPEPLLLQRGRCSLQGVCMEHSAMPPRSFRKNRTRLRRYCRQSGGAVRRKPGGTTEAVSLRPCTGAKAVLLQLNGAQRPFDAAMIEMGV